MTTAKIFLKSKTFKVMMLLGAAYGLMGCASAPMPACVAMHQPSFYDRNFRGIEHPTCMAWQHEPETNWLDADTITKKATSFVIRRVF